MTISGFARSGQGTQVDHLRRVSRKAERDAHRCALAATWKLMITSSASDYWRRFYGVVDRRCERLSPSQTLHLFKSIVVGDVAPSPAGRSRPSIVPISVFFALVFCPPPKKNTELILRPSHARAPRHLILLAFSFPTTTESNRCAARCHGPNRKRLDFTALVICPKPTLPAAPTSFPLRRIHLTHESISLSATTPRSSKKPPLLGVCVSPVDVVSVNRVHPARFDTGIGGRTCGYYYACVGRLKVSSSFVPNPIDRYSRRTHSRGPSIHLWPFT
ncbi:hypothetical protein R3P38DRAFT_3245401 [Favolaschia claudopus]|uniref:Uncharacterized protein n=1 Tax=Favolaschia claudopus TaxID=2862362 RepID=A0AAV9Z0H0_9AGAR